MKSQQIRKQFSFIFHHHGTGVASADFVSTSSTLPMAHPFQIFMFQHLPTKSATSSVVSLRQRHNILYVISATLCWCYMQCLGRKWVNILRFPAAVYPASNWAGICVVFLLISFPRFTEMIVLTSQLS